MHKVGQSLDQHYVDPRLACLYDLDSGWSDDSDFYLSLPGRNRCDILDVGCGTGLLANAYCEQGHSVTAIDPAEAMLDIAREKPNASKIEWIKCAAEDFRTDKRFDLIVMTGNAMMALTDIASVKACLRTMKAHLKTDGKIAFEVRNPALDWSSEWGYQMSLRLNDNEVRETRRFVGMEGPIMRFEFDYVFPDMSLTTKSAIRFHSMAEIQEGLRSVGLAETYIIGGWHGEAFDPSQSHYMIFLAGHLRDKDK